MFSLADEQLENGHPESARRAFLRACTYFRTAGSMLYDTPVDPRMVHSNSRQTAAFRQAAALMANPVEIVQIPFEGTTLPGYFLKADDNGGARATVLGLGGYDGTC